MAKPDKSVAKNLACKIISLTDNEETNEEKINNWLTKNKNIELIEFVTSKYFLVIFYQK